MRVMTLWTRFWYIRHRSVALAAVTRSPTLRVNNPRRALRAARLMPTMVTTRSRGGRVTGLGLHGETTRAVLGLAESVEPSRFGRGFILEQVDGVEIRVVDVRRYMDRVGRVDVVVQSDDSGDIVADAERHLNRLCGVPIVTFKDHSLISKWASDSRADTAANGFARLTRNTVRHTVIVIAHTTGINGTRCGRYG